MVLHFLLIRSYSQNFPLPVTGRGISLFLEFSQIEISYPTGIVFSVCSAISPKNEEGSQSRGTWNTAGLFLPCGTRTRGLGFSISVWVTIYARHLLKSNYKEKSTTSNEVVLFGDPYGNRTHVTAVKGPCLNRLTNGPYNTRFR